MPVKLTSSSDERPVRAERQASSPRQRGGVWRTMIAVLAIAACGLAVDTQAAIAGGSQQREGTQYRANNDMFGAGGWWKHGFHRAGAPQPEGVKTIATGLNQPKKLTVAPDGSLLVALSGSGAPSSDCVTSGEEHPCLNQSGAIDRVTPSGQVTTVLGNLASVSSEGKAAGPAEARYSYGGLEVLFQDEDISATTGEQPFGQQGALLGDLVRFPFWGGAQIQAAFGPFEAQHNPDKGAGTAVEASLESAIDSDPYSFVPYRGGYAVADAAGNDLLWVSPWGDIQVLAVFPTISEVAAPGTLGPQQMTPVPFQAQPVPDSVAVGPDGALYVGELGGVPFNPGTSNVYRVVPGQAPTVYASGFTAIGDIGFDWAGRLLVLEIDQKGLNDAFSSTGLPSPGAIIGVHRDGSQALLASAGLEFPTGLAVGPWGSVYVSNLGILPATGGPEGLSGQVAQVGLPASWLHSWW